MCNRKRLVALWHAQVYAFASWNLELGFRNIWCYCDWPTTVESTDLWYVVLVGLPFRYILPNWRICGKLMWAMSIFLFADWNRDMERLNRFFFERHISLVISFFNPFPPRWTWAFYQFFSQYMHETSWANRNFSRHRTVIK